MFAVALGFCPGFVATTVSAGPMRIGFKNAASRFE
jgi:hypothetical protein